MSKQRWFARELIKPVAAALLTAGAILLAFVALSPSVWARETLVFLVFVAPILGGIRLAVGISFARSNAQTAIDPPQWLLAEMIEAFGLAAAFTVVGVLVGPGGSSGNFSDVTQQFAFAACCLTFASSCLWTRQSRRREVAVQDAERESRLDEARAQARRNVADFVEGLEPKND